MSLYYLPVKWKSNLSETNAENTNYCAQNKDDRIIEFDSEIQHSDWILLEWQNRSDWIPLGTVVVGNRK